MMTNEDIEKAIDLIGKQVYTVVGVYESRPYVKAVKITSVEIYNKNSIHLKTSNDGAFTYGWGRYFLTREEADAKLEEDYGDKTKFEPLKRCPICKAPANIVQYGNKYTIQCCECGLSTALEWKLKDAINKWNDRVE